MNNILEICFEGKNRIDPAAFKQMNEDISSDTVLAVLGLFRERLPCSENFWRYKRNYDLHMKMMEKDNSLSSNLDASSVGGASMMSSNSSMKRIASPKMRHVRALSPYSRWQADGEKGLQN